MVIKYAPISLVLLAVTLSSCSKHDDPIPSTRTYRMGFQNSAPRYTFDEAIKSLGIWTQRADAAIITADVPWDSLYQGTRAEDFVVRNYKDLVSYYRSKNLKLWVYIEPANGLDRASEAKPLLDRGKSMTDPEVQKLYKRFAFVMDSVLMPDHMGLALETNLIRGIASAPVYQAIKQAANEAATEIRNYDANVKLSVSVQVEFAWGKLQGDNQYLGVQSDFLDFPFIEELGLSSYPYFCFENPQEIPINYYTKLLDEQSIPVFVSEGGWSSVTVDKYTGTLQKQYDYFSRHNEILADAKAIALFQLTFTDIDIASLPSTTPSNLNLFAHLGLIDIDFNSKLAMEKWDEMFKMQLEE